MRMFEVFFLSCSLWWYTKLSCERAWDSICKFRLSVFFGSWLTLRVIDTKHQLPAHSDDKWDMLNLPLHKLSQAADEKRSHDLCCWVWCGVLVFSSTSCACVFGHFFVAFRFNRDTHRRASDRVCVCVGWSNGNVVHAQHCECRVNQTTNQKKHEHVTL